MFGVISATYTDKGGQGERAPPLTTTTQVQIRQKHQEVENVVTQSGTTTATNTDGGAGVHRSSIASGRLAAAERSVQPVPDRHGRVPLRGRPAAGRTVGSPLAAVDIRQDSITGPVIATANLDLDGWHRHVGDHDGSAGQRPAGKHELFVTFRTVTGGATGGNLFNLNWVEFGGNGVTVVETSTPGGAGGTVPATLSLVARHAGHVRAVHPGRRADVRREHDGQRHLDRR